MFGKKGNSGDHKANSVVGNSTVVRGDVLFGHSLQIHGIVKGRIKGADDRSQLRVMQEGKIEGDIIAASVQVDGQVLGNIICCSIDIRRNSRIKGNIYYEILQIEANSVINGELVISDKFKQLKKGSQDDKAASAPTTSK